MPLFNSEIDHGDLVGLADDDHAQYALLAGRSGGQTLNGGTASGNDLTLSSTAHATKGKILLGANSAYDQFTDRLGIGTTSPTEDLHVNGTSLLINSVQVGTGGGAGANFTIKGDEVEDIIVVDNVTNTITLGEDVELRSDGPVYFNDNNGDFDSQIKGTTDNFLLFVDASLNHVSVGGGEDAKLQVSGTADETQFLVKGHTTQTSNLAEFHDFNIANSKQISFDASGGAVFNEQGNNADFRIEGDTNANLFFADASADRIGLGGQPNTAISSVSAHVVGGHLLLDNNQQIRSRDAAGTSSIAAFFINGSDNTVFNMGTSKQMLFTEAGSSRMTLDGATAALTLSSTAPSFQMTDTTASAKSLRVVTDGNKSSFYEAAGAAGDILTLDLANNWIGVGTATPGTDGFTSGTQKPMLHVKSDGDFNTFAGVANTDASGTASAAVFRTQASTAIINFQSHGAGRTATRFGVTLANYNELLGVAGSGFLFGTLGSAPVIIGTNSVMAATIDVNQNLGIRTSTFGTSAVGAIGIANGTAPTTSPADMIQIFSVDAAAGAATLGLRTEAAVVTESVSSNRTLRVVINGTVYKVLLNV